MSDADKYVYYKNLEIMEKAYKNPFFLNFEWVPLVMFIGPLMIFVLPSAIIEYKSTGELTQDILIVIGVLILSFITFTIMMIKEGIRNKKKSKYYKKLKEKYIVNTPTT